MKIINALLLSCIAMNFCPATFAGSMGTNSSSQNIDTWHYEVAPYGWLASISADATVKETEHHAFVPLSKILKDLGFVGEMHLEASEGLWTFMLDPTYIRIIDYTVTGPILVGPLKKTVIGPINISLTSQTLLIDSGVFYRAYKTQPAPNQSLSLELLGGARYLGLKNNLVLGLSRLESFPGIAVSGSTTVVAPIVGARIKQDYSQVHLWLRADVGGFGVDKVTNTWSATAGLGYTVSTHVELGVAYRVLKINVAKSTNLSFDALMYGPELGVAFHFDK
jgi:hypothetical protein